MSESEVGSGDSLKDGMLFDGNEMKGKARCLCSVLSTFLKELETERKRKKILQKPGKDVHWCPLIEYGQVL